MFSFDQTSVTGLEITDLSFVSSSRHHTHGYRAEGSRLIGLECVFIFCVNTCLSLPCILVDSLILFLSVVLWCLTFLLIKSHLQKLVFEFRKDF